MSKVLSELAQVNPQVKLPADAGALMPVSFVPMADVTESGDWVGHQVRRLCDVDSGFTVFADGDILVAKITPCFENGKGAQVVGLTSGIGFGSTEFHVLRARDGVSPRFIYHVTQSERLRRAAEAYMSGSAGQKRVPREFFEAFCVPDLALKEQRKISAILDALDTAIRRTEAIIEKLKQVKQGLLHDLLTRGIDDNGELRPPQSQAPHLYKESPLGWIPREWQVQPLASSCDLIRDGTHLPPVRVESGPLLLSVRNMRDGRLVLTDQDTRVADSFYQLMHKHWTIQPGDVLLAIVGATIGKLAIVGDHPKFTLQRSVAVLRGADRLLISQFLFYSMLHKGFQDRLWARVNQTAQPGIYLDQLGALEISLPPIAEQEAATSRIRGLDSRINAEQALLSKLHLQKSGLMDDLLTGRVRVTPSLEAAAASA